MIIILSARLCKAAKAHACNCDSGPAKAACATRTDLSADNAVAPNKLAAWVSMLV